MNILTACVPSPSLCPSITIAFARLGIKAEASATAPTRVLPQAALPCPIEPAEKHRIWITILDNTPIADFLEATFLSADFIVSMMPLVKNEDDSLTLECLVTASSARSIEQAFLSSSPPHKLYRAARAEGRKKCRRHLAESMLGVPNLVELLVEFTDSLVAGPQPAALQR